MVLGTVEEKTIWLDTQPSELQMPLRPRVDGPLTTRTLNNPFHSQLTNRGIPMLDPQTVSILIYGVQAILGALAIHGIIYRLIAIDFRLVPAAGNALFLAINDIKLGRTFRRSVEERAGWLRRLSEGHETTELSSEIEELFCQSQAYLSILAMVAAIETLFGLLGTVAGFIVSESIESMSLSIAFGTTFWGIVASLPPALYLYCSEPFRNRLHFQMQSFLDATMQSVESAGVKPPDAVQPALKEAAVMQPTVQARDRAQQSRPDHAKQNRARSHASGNALAVQSAAPLATRPTLSSRSHHSMENDPPSNPTITDGDRALILLDATADQSSDFEAYRLAPLTTRQSSTVVLRSES